MFMQSSPGGRTIRELEGDAGTIRRRSGSIASLGIQMQDSATFLRTLAEQTDDQRGEAVEKLREIVADTYEELQRAGRLYEPTGPVLVSYADALDDVQPRINASAQRCAELWQSYAADRGHLPGTRPSFGAPEEGTPEAAANEQADARKEAKYEDFIAEARTFDREYDTWETAFDTAVSGITEVLDGKIEDDFWDKMDGFAAGTLEVLSVVGIVVGIAAIIIGGPIFAAIGTVVGLITLGLTIYQAIRNDKGWDAVLIAAIGVIPFGSAGKLFQQGKRLEFLGDIVSKSNFAKWGAEGQSIRSLFTGAGGGWRGLLAAGKGNFLAHNPMGPGDFMSRLMLGKDTTKLTQIAEAMVDGPARGQAVWEFSYMMLSGPWKLGDNIMKWTGHGDQTLSKQFPLVGALL